MEMSFHSDGFFDFKLHVSTDGDELFDLRVLDKSVKSEEVLNEMHFILSESELRKLVDVCAGGLAVFRKNEEIHATGD